MKDRITGQLFFRSKGDARDGRRLFMVFGVLAVPRGVDIPDEHQLTFLGIGLPELEGIRARS